MTPFVLVLIAAPGSGAVLERMARDAGGDGSVMGSKPVWLGDGEAVEIAFEADGSAEAKSLRDRLATRHASERVDICVVPAAGRRKRLLIADMDSTIIAQECIDEMADMLGLKDPISAITERAMRGELAFEEALRERLALLRGLAETDLERVWRERITLTAGARTLLATMTAAGAATALVSGGFTYFTSRVAAKAGFQQNHANVLEIVEGRLTGRVAGPILGREAKLATLQRLTRELGLGQHDTLAVGDGANDLAMIEAAGLGVAFRAKPIVAAQAHAAITYGDLTALLYLQGYRRDAFVAE
jgi:phosphoserine phosphatase